MTWIKVSSALATLPLNSSIALGTFFGAKMNYILVSLEQTIISKSRGSCSWILRNHESNHSVWMFVSWIFSSWSWRLQHAVTSHSILRIVVCGRMPRGWIDLVLGFWETATSQTIPFECSCRGYFHHEVGVCSMQWIAILFAKYTVYYELWYVDVCHEGGLCAWYVVVVKIRTQ
jgi:hypothetical protein